MGFALLTLCVSFTSLSFLLIPVLACLLLYSERRANEVSWERHNSALISLLLSICFSGIITHWVPLRGGAWLVVAIGVSWLSITVPLWEAVKSEMRFAAVLLALVNCLLVSLLPYGVFRAQRTGVEHAYRSECLSHIYVVRDALKKYASAHDGIYPPREEWQEALKPFMPIGRNFLCSFHSIPAAGYVYTPPHPDRDKNPTSSRVVTLPSSSSMPR